MLDSLVRVSRRVLRVPETESSQTDTRTVRDSTAATTGAPHPRAALGQEEGGIRRCLASGRTRRARARFVPTTVRRPVGDTSRSTQRQMNSEAKTSEGYSDRHRTGRDVLLREKCTPSADATRATRDRRPKPRTSNQRTCAEEWR